jgi:hypothetical protein
VTTAPSARLAAGRPDARGIARQVAAAPVIVLTYAYSGLARLRLLLEQQHGLACTQGTGILPACEQAANAWRTVDDRDTGPLSPLACASVRALTTSLITALLLREGKQRWCEIVTAPPASAETFLHLYPGTRVICLHRACPDVSYAALHAGPWGLGPGFAPFTAAYPGSTAAALAAFWAARTAPLLAFEREHPQHCRRLRYEDLTASRQSGLLTFLGLDGDVPDGPRWPASTAASAGGGPAASDPATGARISAPQPSAMAELIPAPLLSQVNQLAGELDYPPLG